MAYRSVLLSLFITCLCTPAFSQSFSVHIAPGFDVGRWLYDKGLDKQGNAIGWDRGTLSVQLPLQLSFMMHLNRWSVGLDATQEWLFDYELIPDTDASLNDTDYLISNGSVPMTLLGIKANYLLSDKQKLRFRPQFGFGTFIIQSIHPQQEDFKTRFYYKIGVLMDIKINEQFSFLLEPVHGSRFIIPDSPEAQGDFHQIISFGIKTGIKWTFPSS